MKNPDGIDIGFEFRFNRNIDKNKEELSIRKKLIIKVITQYFPNAIKAHLFPVERAGNSGSEVFYLQLDKKGKRSIYFVAKFQKKSDVIEEHNKAKYVLNYNKNLGALTYIDETQDETEPLSVLLYKMDQIDVIEFRAHFLDTSKTDANCIDALNLIYEDLKQLHIIEDKSTEKTYEFATAYKPYYMPSNNGPLNHIKALTLANGDYIGLSSIAASIISSYNQILSTVENETFKARLIHGDLHARNLMVSVSKSIRLKAELIDFAWSCYSHPAMDFSLMEATLKYMLLYELLKEESKNGKASVNKPHLPISTFVAFEKYLCGNVFYLPSIDDFEAYISTENIHISHLKGILRVYGSIKALREKAGETLNQYYPIKDDSKLTPEKILLISNFLITLGQIRFKEVQPIWILVGLDTIGKEICKIP